MQTTVSDLVLSFLIPEVERQTVFEVVDRGQEVFRSAARKAIFGDEADVNVTQIEKLEINDTQPQETQTKSAENNVQEDVVQEAKDAAKKAQSREDLGSEFAA
jgi:hypothetical protein